MDDLDDLQASEFVTDTEDQDSLDERIDSEQRLRNNQLWASFQNAACCITKLYKDRTQPNLSPWIPFQNAASNLTTLYKDCIESQKRFARIGYQAGRRKQMRDINKLLKKHKIPTTEQQQQQTVGPLKNQGDNSLYDQDLKSSAHHQQQQCLTNASSNSNNVASILAVNQLNLECDDTTSPNANVPAQNMPQNQLQHQQNQQQPQQQQQILHGNNEEDLITFQQALVQPAIKGVRSNQLRRACHSSSPGYFNNRTIDREEERLLELNQFLSEEYHRHVGSRKRSCNSLGGSSIKRFRE